MSDVPQGFDCRNCGHRVTGEEADRQGWCTACRAVVVRRSAWLAAIPALVVLGAYLWLLSRFGLFQSTFLIVFMALGAGLTWVAFKVARRVFFDVIRARGVKPPIT